jgi:Na+/H+ antiporter NhaC
MILYLLYMTLPIAILAGIVSLFAKKRTKTIEEVWTVNNTTFAGQDAEEQAKLYAKYLIKNKVKAIVTIPGCPEMNAKDVWD